MENDEVIEQGNNGGGDSTPAFSIPEEYKDKAWASQMHSLDDLCKKIDNQEKFISKGQLPHRDSSESDLNAFSEKMKKYTAELDYSDLTGKDEDLAKALKESGVPKFQAKAVVDLIKSREAKEYGEEEFNNLLSEKFKGRESDLEKAKSMLKEMGEEKSKRILSKHNDDAVEIMDILAEVSKKYNVSPATAMAKLSESPMGSQPMTGLDWSKPETKKAYMAELDAWYKNPHATEADKQAIMKKYGRI